MACTLFPGVGAVLLVLLVNQLLNPQCRGGDLCGRSTGEDESLQHDDERRWCKVAGKMFAGCLIGRSTNQEEEERTYLRPQAGRESPWWAWPWSRRLG